MPDPSLSGKIVAVTGASGRLGRILARRFADAGAAVAAVVEKPELAAQVELAEGGRHAFFTADVADEASARGCFNAVAERFGRLDVLVHAVGMWEGRPVTETTLAQWDLVMRVNLTSTFLCFREALRLMGGRGGRLIAFASAQGVDRARAEQAAYSAAKAGVMRLVEAVAAEQDGRGVTAHAIAPSSIVFEGTEQQAGVRAAELADLCLYLCGPAGNALNGATLRAYGTGR